MGNDVPRNTTANAGYNFSNRDRLYVFCSVCFHLPFGCDRLAVASSNKNLESSIYLLNPKVSGYPRHYEIHQPPSHIYWNLEDRRFPKMLLIMKGITVSTAKLFHVSCYEMKFKLELLNRDYFLWRDEVRCSALSTLCSIKDTIRLKSRTKLKRIRNIRQDDILRDPYLFM